MSTTPLFSTDPLPVIAAEPEPFAIIVAEMADGSTIVERAACFASYVDLVLGFRADPDVRRVSWSTDDPLR